MRSIPAMLAALWLAVMFPPAVFAQAAQPSPAVSVPRVFPIAGVFRPADGQPASPEEVVTVSVYADETGNAPLWQETQRVRVDAEGRYTVLMGATADGVPQHVLASGAQWVSVLFARPGEVEGPRGRLTSVPYALRAADADTLGGRPASSYVLAPTGAGSDEPAAASSGSTIVPMSGVDVLMGTTNKLAKYLDPATVGDSAVYESGGFVGIGTTNPRDHLHVRFSNDAGTLTGYAVQNMEANPSAYSGMLFYDEVNNLGVFQGFNNLSHEYRINNVARVGAGPFDGSINFLIGGASAFRVNSSRNVGIGTTTPADRLQVFGDIRVGTAGTNGCINDFSGAALTGVCSSDARLKKDVTPFGPSLGPLTALRPVTYSWRVDEFPHRRFGNGRASGLIAQEVEQVLPDLVVTGEDGFKAVDYRQLPLLTIQAVKELKAEKDALTTRVAELERLVRELMVSRTLAP
jgi:hypothetical protein